ncbi:MAG: acetyl-CoA carboxylase biotin carboxylase subunit [Spirochaetota bacterium]|nr:acetyl-CoA carboxylase biotin carboxylase subunit [Spirochaetota bacterium]
MIKKVLIANRGEIALRIIQACKELNIKTVAVHSTADEFSLHRRFADEDVCIGPPDSTKSYLHIPSIISAAEITGADAIHPGYGFLSENGKFSQICQENHINFIGPCKEVIDLMGDKSTARKTMEKAGVPIIPGSEILEGSSHGIKIAKEIGFPVIIKATAGGGGKGMRVVYSEAEFEHSLSLAQAEAEKAFQNPGVYIEKFFEAPRHIEIQILGDSKGNIIHLGERDCSIQRRHQKLIEESPSPILNHKIREKMGEIAVKGAKAVNYVGAGTIEFLMDSKNNFYFMEMNTRIQVEHPVTEFVTGIDLIKEQIRIADGGKLKIKQEDVVFRGHSIECRINAENPHKNFTPSTGKVKYYHIPGGFGVRVDSHLYAEYEIPPYYDSLLAKLIVWGRDRKEAINKMLRSLNEFIIEGVDTTIPFHKKVMTDDNFVKGEYSTHFIENFSMEKNK